MESVLQGPLPPAGIPPVISVHTYMFLFACHYCSHYLGSAGAVTIQSVALKRPFSVPSLGRVDRPAVSVHCTCIM